YRSASTSYSRVDSSINLLIIKSNHMKVSVKRGPGRNSIANTDVADGEIVYFKIGSKDGLLQRFGEIGVVLGQPRGFSYPYLFKLGYDASDVSLNRVDPTSIKFDRHGSIIDFAIHDESIGANE